ncbi:MAG: nucleotidyltransferase family protein, partial [Gemmatimonadaceae bacterium]
YKEPVERTFGDIDLLFPDEEVQPAMRILEQLGYVAPADEVASTYAALHFHYVMDKPNGFKVEVHWALERPDSSYRLDTAAFVANTTTIVSKVLGSFRTPRPEYAVLHLSVQNLENGFAKLSRLVDIDRLARTEGFDWSLLQTLAQDAHARVVVHTSLRLCAELLDTPVPPAALRSIAASSTARWHVATLEPARVVLEQRAHTRAAVSLLIDLWCRDSTRSRLQAVGELLRGRDLALGQTGEIGSRPAAAFKNAVRVAKLAAYQLFLYGRRPFIHPHTLPEYPS